MPTRMAYARRGAGFTLLELLIAVAIIAILLALMAPALMEGRCTLKVAGALDKLKECEGLFAGATPPTVARVVECLKAAQALIDELDRQNWFGKNRAAFRENAEKINKLVDDLKTKVDSPEDREKLEKAKLTVPAGGAGTGAK